ATNKFLNPGARGARRNSLGTHPLASRQVRFAEGLEKIVAALKIGAAVLFRLRQPADLDHVEYDVAEVLARMDAPLLEQAHRHRPELRERKLADAGQQLLPGDMARAALARTGDGFLRVVQRLAHKCIRLLMVARVLGLD